MFWISGGEVYVKNFDEKSKFYINAVTPEFLKDAFGLHVLPSHLTSSGGMIVPINSIWLMPNETYTMSEDEHDIHEKEKRALGE